MLFSWTFRELSFNSRSSAFTSPISYDKRRVCSCILFIWLKFYLQDILIQGKYSEEFHFSFTFYLLVFYCTFSAFYFHISNVLRKSKFSFAVINFRSKKHYLKLAGICYHVIKFKSIENNMWIIVYELLLHKLVSMSIW